MKFEYLKFWLRWYWFPYKEETMIDVSFCWLCFEVQMKKPANHIMDGWDGEVKVWDIVPSRGTGSQASSKSTTSDNTK